MMINGGEAWLAVGDSCRLVLVKANQPCSLLFFEFTHDMCECLVNE